MPRPSSEVRIGNQKEDFRVRAGGDLTREEMREREEDPYLA